MPGPAWNDDDPGDTQRIVGNTRTIADGILVAAAARAPLLVADIVGWHAGAYAGCQVPSAGYVGHFRGDPGEPDLDDYEVIVGGHPGVASADVTTEVIQLVAAVNQACGGLDQQLPAGTRPTTAQELHAVLLLAAYAHGEFVRIHPFANGNGRSARLLVAWVCFRYGLPMFLALRPRPGDPAYAAAAAASMQGQHELTARVFSHLLTLHLFP